MATGSPSATYFTLVRSLLRPEGATDSQKESARQACQWLTDNIGKVRNFTEGEHCTLLGLIYDHWLAHHEGPNLKIVKHRVQLLAEPALTALFTDFEETAASWVHHDPEDLPSLFGTLIAEHKTMKSVRVLNNAIIVATQGVDIKKGRDKVHYQGADDAFRYVIEKMDDNVLGNVHGAPSHGTLAGAAHRLATQYDKKKAPGTNNEPMVTGIGALDDEIRPMRGQLVGVAGYAKSGKTRFGRTWMYHLISHGFNVMHLTYEQTFDEELAAYALIHSYNEAIWGPGRGIPLKAFRNGCLTQAQENFLRKELIPDLEQRKSLPGNLAIRQPEGDATWESAVVQVNLTNNQVPLDAVWVDYLAALSVDPRREREAHNRMVQDAKTLAMTFDSNRGLLVASPFQVNRDAWAAAGQRDGRYEANCCYMYSQIEKAVDTLYYVYSDDGLAKLGQAKVGTCITRHSEHNVAPVAVTIRRGCGSFVGAAPVVETGLNDGALDAL